MCHQQTSGVRMGVRCIIVYMLGMQADTIFRYCPMYRRELWKETNMLWYLVQVVRIETQWSYLTQIACVDPWYLVWLRSMVTASLPRKSETIYSFTDLQGHADVR